MDYRKLSTVSAFRFLHFPVLSREEVSSEDDLCVKYTLGDYDYEHD